jgi:hypothetical protein
LNQLNARKPLVAFNKDVQTWGSKAWFRNWQVPAIDYGSSPPLSTQGISEGTSSLNSSISQRDCHVTYLMTPMWHLNLPTFFIRRICSAWSGLGGERVMLDKTQLRFEN